MKIKRTFTPLLVASVLFLASCSGNSNDTKTDLALNTELGQESSDDDFILPQPISLANAFKTAGLTYTKGKTNPVSAKDSYSKKIDQLLNLGVYSTDLAYCAINNKSQEAREYLIVVQSLGSKVGLESVFSDKKMIDKFDKNLGNPEALEELIYDIQDKSDSYLDDNDLKYLAAIEFAGAWAEGMYLGIDDSKKKGDLGTALVDQMSLLKNTIKGLKSHPAKKDVRLNQVIALFESVLDTYNALPSVQKADKNINFEVPKLSASEFNQVADKIVALRTNIVVPTQSKN